MMNAALTGLAEMQLHHTKRKGRPLPAFSFHLHMMSLFEGRQGGGFSSELVFGHTGILK